MKRPIALLASLLAVTVLATAAAAAGGDSSDPLISLNYLQTVFTAKANSSIDASLDKTGQTAYTQAETVLRSTVAAAEANAGAQRADVFTEARLKQGDMLSGPTGLQVIVLAGNANVQFSSGAVIDVTTGSEVSSGASLAENHRYLVAEDTTALFAVTGKTAVLSYCGLYSLSPAPSVDYPAMAAALKTISLFRGSDTGYGEGFDLEKAPTRMEALIMLIRLLGEESEALTCTAYQPFADVPDWAEPYAAYAYAKGYTNGVEPTMFGTTMSASAEMYTEFLLRALRYSSTAQTDISNAPERAYFAGVLTSGVDRGCVHLEADFRRGECAARICLFARRCGLSLLLRARNERKRRRRIKRCAHRPRRFLRCSLPHLPRNGHLRAHRLTPFCVPTILWIETAAPVVSIFIGGSFYVQQ